ncbi:MAG: glycosyltransferase [Patescibacteria group bacterium]|nr:glycosyltransferase [Patescibacteria group bacterium]
MNKKNLLVTLADKKYLDFAKQLFSSVYFNSGWQGDYMLLAHEVPEEDLKWFRDKGILIKKCEPLAEKLVGRWPAVILSKLYLFTSEFKQWDKIIFLDADLIVCASLDDLLEVKNIAGFTNYSLYLQKSRLKHLFYKADKKIRREGEKLYDLNSLMLSGGVFVFSTTIIKKNTFTGLKELADKYQTIFGALEEMILTLYFIKQLQIISPLYCLNVFSLIKYNCLKPQKTRAIIINFFNCQKPIDYHPYFYKIWRYNLDRADEINLSLRLPPTKIWGHFEIKKYELLLKMRRVFFIPYAMLYRLIESLDFLIGLTGIWLKKDYPKSYYFLKKLIKNE